MTGSDKKPPLRYADSPNAPEWARDPASRGGNSPITSFGKPIPQAEETPRNSKELQYSDHPNAPDWARHPSHRRPVPPKVEPEPLPPSKYIFPVEAFERFLWRHSNADVKVYGLFDGRHCEALYGRLLETDLKWTHLYQGDAAVLNPQYGPFLIAFEQGHELTRWLLTEGWGQGWGIWFTASTSLAQQLYTPRGGREPVPAAKAERTMFVQLEALTLEDTDPLILLRKHFRRFTKVEFEEDGRIVLFRYYDPLVLRRYLPTCSLREYKGFFGPVSVFFCEGYHFVESLKRPQDCYRFSLVPDAETGELRYLGERFDVEADKIEMLPQHEASKGKLERPTGPWVTIRTGQSEAMRQQEEEYFVASVTADLAAVITAIGYKPVPVAIRPMVIRQIAVGRSLGLTTERELLAFATFALVYGEGKDRTNPTGRKVVEMCTKRGENQRVAEYLNHYSKLGISVREC